MNLAVPLLNIVIFHNLSNFFKGVGVFLIFYLYWV